MKKMMFACIFFSLCVFAGSETDFSYHEIVLGMESGELLKKIKGCRYFETTGKIVVGSYYDASVLVCLKDGKVTDFTVKTDCSESAEFETAVDELSSVFGKPMMTDKKKKRALFRRDGKYVSLRFNKKPSGFTRFTGFAVSSESYSISAVLDD